MPGWELEQPALADEELLGFAFNTYSGGLDAVPCPSSKHLAQIAA